MLLKTILGLTAGVTGLVLAFGIWFQAGSRRVARAEAQPTGGVSCSLDGDQLQARTDLIASFVAGAREIRPLPTGYALDFSFGAKVLEETSRLIADESRCCPFFDYRLTVLPSEDSLVLEITGPEGAKELLSTVIPASTAAVKTSAGGNSDEQPSCDCLGASGCKLESCLPSLGAKGVKSR